MVLVVFVFFQIIIAHRLMEESMMQDLQSRIIGYSFLSVGYYKMFLLKQPAV